VWGRGGRRRLRRDRLGTAVSDEDQRQRPRHTRALHDGHSTAAGKTFTNVGGKDDTTRVVIEADE
jgi:hypothetical protein